MLPCGSLRALEASICEPVRCHDLSFLPFLYFAQRSHEDLLILFCFLSFQIFLEDYLATQLWVSHFHHLLFLAKLSRTSFLQFLLDDNIVLFWHNASPELEEVIFFFSFCSSSFVRLVVLIMHWNRFLVDGMDFLLSLSERNRMASSMGCDWPPIKSTFKGFGQCLHSQTYRINFLSFRSIKQIYQFLVSEL